MICHYSFRTYAHFDAASLQAKNSCLIDSDHSLRQVFLVLCQLAQVLFSGKGLL
jgi:hypothetical protein